MVRSDIEREHALKGTIQGLEKGMAEILYLASLAPSGRNMQPWFARRIKPYEYAVGLDKARRFPAVDPDNREATLSIGAFVENLCLAATSLGFEPEVEVKGTGAPEEDLVRVSLTKARPSDFPIGRITSRRTVKKGYLPKPLSAEHARILSAAWPGHVFYFDRDSKHEKCLAEWTTPSDTKHSGTTPRGNLRRVYGSAGRTP